MEGGSHIYCISSKTCRQRTKYHVINLQKSTPKTCLKVLTEREEIVGIMPVSITCMFLENKHFENQYWRIVHIKYHTVGIVLKSNR